VPHGDARNAVGHLIQAFAVEGVDHDGGGIISRLWRLSPKFPETGGNQGLRP
jgi:hypothetical protein